MAYFISFFWSSSFAFLAQKKKRFCILFLLLSAAPLIFLGAIRSPRVGTDNYYFFQNTFMWAKGYQSFDSFMNAMGGGDLLSYAYFYYVRLISADYHWFCFFTILTSIFILYLAVYLLRDRCPMWSSVLFYNLLLFGPMLCFVRQSMALSMCLLSVVFVLKKKLLPFLLCIVIASLFHMSACFFASAYLLNVFLEDEKKRVFRSIIVVVAVLLGIALFTFVLPQITLTMIFTGDRSTTLINRYISTDENQGTIRHAIFMVLLHCPLAFIPLMTKKIRNSEYIPLIVVIIIGVMIELLGFQDPHIHRLSYYFLVPAIFILSIASRYSLLVLGASIMYCLAYFIRQVVFNGLAFSLPVYPFFSDVSYFENIF